MSGDGPIRVELLLTPPTPTLAEIARRAYEIQMARCRRCGGPTRAIRGGFQCESCGQAQR